MRPYVVLVTRRPYILPNVTLPMIHPTKARSIFLSWGNQCPLYHDIETTGENPYLSKLLLEAWYNGDPSQPILVLDSHTVDTEEVVRNVDLKNRVIVAHNADFEKRWAIKRGLFEGRFYCTMVSEQTIMSGITDLKYDIRACYTRRGVPIHPEMDKTIRNEFIGADPATFTLANKHILYNATDVEDLKLLKDKQQIWIDKLNMNFLVHHLRSPLITALAEAEMIGFLHNSTRWNAIAARKQVEAEGLVLQLNNYVVAKGLDLLSLNPTLKELYNREVNKKERLETRLKKVTLQIEELEAKGKTSIKAYTLAKETLVKVQLEIDSPKVLPLPTVNWASPQQPLAVMTALGINPLPMDVDKKTRRPKPSANKAARTNWFAENENHALKDFMELFDKFKKIEHNIKSFGVTWVEMYVNPVTGKVHTCFRQSGTRTGRFASGDRHKNYFNLQQIPGEITTLPDGSKIAEYRACFGTDPGRKIATLDYTGCEIICMISLSNDLELKKISELPDQHSYMGTKCWRAVYKHRYEKTGDPKWKELSETYVMGGKSKERTKFKQSGVFPVIYGVKPPKVASIQGFSKEEGQIFIDTIEAEMPNVVAFVKTKAAFALAHGYVLHNTRTNSRRWFKNVLDANKHGLDLSNKEEAAVETAARNSPIQGKRNAPSIRNYRINYP